MKLLDEKSNIQSHPDVNYNDQPEIYDHWCNCGTNVMEVNNHF